ncbi:bifunctional polysaccharide deacetylase/glycosyltransferase family 2 protein [Streptomyces sp. NPDC001922]|uniref:bifunctional polysaccharide deacetylase/glycosyltransferase family 2 protein n=1 Tax=Streptomyces sp. NPDC001922 TaxID=3364624 RepID=UPI00369A3879
MPVRTIAAVRRAAPRPRLVLSLVALVSVVCVLLLDGFLRAKPDDHCPAHTPGYAGSVPEEVRTGGPVLTFRDGEATSHTPPSRTVALTFDDGPDPRWTPKVLDILREHRVPATFFVVGRQAVRYPGLIRRMRAAGSEIGLHTFSHPDLANQDVAGVDREVARTQLALAGAAGISSSLFRAPYTAHVSGLDDRAWRVQQHLGAQGYMSAFVDRNSLDRRGPGVPQIVRNATPPEGRGAVVLFHDAGGNRSRTLAALPRYIERMKARHYTFTTVTRAVGAPGANRPASGLRLWHGRALVLAAALGRLALPGLAALLVVVGAAMVGRIVLMTVFARRHHRIRNGKRFSWGPPVDGPVTVVVPAYNEKECIAHTVNSLAASTVPIEILVVDDGSTDGTADLAEALGLPNVRVLRQPNAGKPAALNRGISEARSDIVVMMDGDTVFEPETVRELVRPFADPSVGAVAGNAKVGNRRKAIGAWQHIEYVMGFNLDRRMYDLLGCMPTIPGAIGAFRRRALLDIGGMSADTLAEDTDVTIALHRAGWRIVYQEHARAWTEAPGSVGQLWRQRYRWSYGTMQALWKHRWAVLDRGPSGRFGRIGLPLVALFQILTPACAPLIDLFTLYGALFGDPLTALALWCTLLLVQLASAAYAFRLDREPLRCLVMLPLQQIAYRQLMYLVLIHSCVTAATGARLPWHKLRRTGEVSTPLAAEAVR